jgi:hypothetical protein
VADAFAIAQHHGVNSADCAGIIRKICEQWNHCLLARVSDVESGKSLAFGPGEQVGQSCGAHAKDIQIERPILVIQALGTTLTLVQRWSAGCLNARTD